MDIGVEAVLCRLLRGWALDLRLAPGFGNQFTLLSSLQGAHTVEVSAAKLGACGLALGDL